MASDVNLRSSWDTIIRCQCRTKLLGRRSSNGRYILFVFWTGVSWNSESSGAALWHRFLWYTLSVLDDVARLQYCTILFENHNKGKQYINSFCKKKNKIHFKKNRISYTYYNVNESFPTMPACVLILHLLKIRISKND